MENEMSKNNQNRDIKIVNPVDNIRADSRLGGRRVNITVKPSIPKPKDK